VARGRDADGGRPLSEHETRFEAWQVALDRIELDVIRAERALATGRGLPQEPDEWRVPDDYGPIPVALRVRAQELLGRQRDALQGMAAQLGVNAQHQSLVRDVERVTTRSGDGPVYVDVAF
jgi:hypothetical protein